MVALQAVLGLLAGVNSYVLKIGRWFGFGALLLMVVAILLQIFFRYVLNNALPWPEEAARALMIWMMAMVAPTAYRHAGFVAIEMLPDMLSRNLRNMLLLAILLLSSLTLIFMLGHAWDQYTAPLLFDSSGLNRLLQDTGINQLLGTDLKFRTAYIFLAMVVLMVILLSVSAELILRQIGRLVFGDKDFPYPVNPVHVGDM